jgi:hypothetical protein
MPYSKFTKLETIQKSFDVTIDYRASLFPGQYSAKPSQLLTMEIESNLTVALATGTEKARSEMLITPILLEIYRKMDSKIALFSGIDFNVDVQKGLNGFCDYILSHSDNLYNLGTPIFALVEAKNERISEGLAQCAAEMIAARIFNEREQNAIETIWGTVTTGTNWRFLRLRGSHLEIDSNEEYLQPLDRLLGILMHVSAV